MKIINKESLIFHKDLKQLIKNLKQLMVEPIFKQYLIY